MTGGGGFVAAALVTNGHPIFICNAITAEGCVGGLCNMYIAVCVSCKLTSLHYYMQWTYDTAIVKYVLFYIIFERMASSDLVAKWDVTLSDNVHRVEFEHGTTTGKRVIRVDGNVCA